MASSTFHRSAAWWKRQATMVRSRSRYSPSAIGGSAPRRRPSQSAWIACKRFVKLMLNYVGISRENSELALLRLWSPWRALQQGDALPVQRLSPMPASRKQGHCARKKLNNDLRLKEARSPLNDLRTLSESTQTLPYYWVEASDQFSAGDLDLGAPTDGWRKRDPSHTLLSWGCIAQITYGVYNTRSLHSNHAVLS